MDNLTPTQRLVYEAIKALINNPEVTVLPTERSLARQLEISKPVIHEVLNILTSEGVIPPVVGKRRMLRKNGKNDANEIPMIAVIGITASANPIITAALRREIIIRGYNPLFCEITNRDLNRAQKIENPMPPVKGAIAVTVWDKKVLTWLEKFSCPVVILDHISQSRQWIDILPDERRGCKQIVKFFRDCGVRSLVYLDYIDDTWNPPRWDAFVCAANILGLDIKKRLFMPENVLKICDVLPTELKSLPRKTGLFCANPAICQGLDHAMTKLGMESPKDYPIACVGEHDMCINGDKHVTRYSLDWQGAAAISAAALDEMIKKPATSRERRLFPVKIFRGQTL